MSARCIIDETLFCIVLPFPSLTKAEDVSDVMSALGLDGLGECEIISTILPFQELDTIQQTRVHY